MTIDADLVKIAEQEKQLVFKRFDLDTAWQLGSLLREMARQDALGVAIDVHLHSMPAFYAALPGSTADNLGWVRRKRGLVLRFFQSSYAIGRKLAAQQTTLEEKFGLSGSDYAAHGGSFPITVAGTGCIGAVTVSGLTQRDDHEMVVRALCALQGRDYPSLALD